MISVKKLYKLARKWQKLAAIKRKRITLPLSKGAAESSICSTSTKAKKGHFVVYSSDKKRFLLPLEYLDNQIIRELFNMAEEEFGLCSNEPLKLPCEAELLEFAIALIKQQVNREVERAVLNSISRSCNLSYFHLQHQAIVHQLPICSY